MKLSLERPQVAPGLFQRARDVGVSGPFDDPPALRTSGPQEALRDGGACHTAGAALGWPYSETNAGAAVVKQCYKCKLL